MPEHSGFDTSIAHSWVEILVGQAAAHAVGCEASLCYVYEKKINLKPV